MRKVEWLVAAWLLALLGFQAARFEVDLLLGTITALAVLLLGAATLIAVLVVAFRRRDARALAALLLVLAMGLAWWLLPLHRAGAALRTWREQDTYAAVLAQLAAGTAPDCIAAGRCLHEPDPPVRVAFVWSRILDNWVGVVHDPAGAIGDVARQREAFGGDLVSAEHLWGPWWFVVYT